MKYIQALFLLTASATTLIAAYSNLRYPSVNRAFVRHTLAMDTTFPDGARDRAIESERVVGLAHNGVIVTETLSGLLCLVGGLLLPFNRAGLVLGRIGLAVGVLLFFGGFRAIGGEWFQMWQSKDWNGLPDGERIGLMMAILWVGLGDD